MKLFLSPLASAAGALVLGILAGCGAGGVSVADGGIRGTGSSVGPVSGFGSVFVNGVEFFTDSILNRKVDSNDGVHSEGDLQKGMILRINGKWEKNGTGHAKSMGYDDSLRGTVSGLTPSPTEKELTFKIHGQTVFADSQTVFKGKSFTTLANGDFVRVSAWRQANDQYRASYVGVLPASYATDLANSCSRQNGNDCYPIEVEGPVDENSLTSTQFEMNGLVINFSNADFAGGLSAKSLRQGAYYEVEGKLVGTVLQASRIQPDDFRRYQKSGKDIELAGPISRPYSDNSKSFELNGLTIRVTGNTEMDDLTVDDLKKTGLLVQVEGEFVSATVIQATEIEIREGDAEVGGDIDAGSFSQDSDFTGSFSVGGVQVHITPQTTITNDDSKDRLKVKDLNPNLVKLKYVSVEISGLEKKDRFGNTYVEALTIEREVSDEVEDEYEVEGKLETIIGDDVKLLGARIRTTPDAFESPLSRIGLESRLADDEKIILEVKYKKVGSGTVPTPYIATSIEEDD